jgi:hypothetical protein
MKRIEKMKHTPSKKYTHMPETLIPLLSFYRNERGFNARSYIIDKAEILNEYMKYSGLSSCVTKPRHKGRGG